MSEPCVSNRNKDNHGTRKLNSGWKEKILSITEQAIRRGTFRSVKELVEKIDQYVQALNNHVQPW